MVGMDGANRAEAALLLEEPDGLPIARFGITPPITSKIIGRTPYYRNTPLCWDAISEGKVDYVNRMIAKDQLDLHKKLREELVRVYPNAYHKGIRVEKVGANHWRVNGVLRRWVPQTNMNWAVQEGQPHSEEEVIDAVKSRIRTRFEHSERMDEGLLYPLKFLARELRGQALLFGGADGTFPDRLRLLKWMYTHPDLVKGYIHHEVNVAIESGKLQVEAGADGLFNGEDYAYKNGPLMSPLLFKRFIFPELKRETEAFKKLGAFVILHSDGDLGPLLSHIVDAGVDGVHPLDPTAGMDIGEVKRQFGDRICLVGNINLHTLDFGSVEDVAMETRKCIRDASPEGGHILTTANVVEVGVKFENFIAMMNTARKYGKYAVGGS